jgi:hypothetical protein
MYFLFVPVRTSQARERIYHTWIVLLLVCGALFVWCNPLKHEFHLNNVQDVLREAHCVFTKLQRTVCVFKTNDLCVPWETVDSNNAKLMTWPTEYASYILHLLKGIVPFLPLSDSRLVRLIYTTFRSLNCYNLMKRNTRIFTREYQTYRNFTCTKVIWDSVTTLAHQWGLLGELYFTYTNEFY